MENWGPGERSQVELQQALRGKCKEICYYLEQFLHAFVLFKA